MPSLPHFSRIGTCCRSLEKIRLSGSMEKHTGQGTASCKPLTTFVQTDTNAFREVVQRLTGPSETDAAQGSAATKVAASMKRSTSKLHERRQYTRPKLVIVKPTVNFKPLTSPTTSRNPSLHPSPVGTPSTVFSKLTIEEEENKGESIISEEEEKAIKERRFYLHPSPQSKPPPELLTLFPLTSHKTS
ncbi:VQ motif-containing protein 31-like [Mercurialis annua]|uniref:VQ motif-containing protein 31-like n=1 Tax=Mercurialis annua TaxID=3986 RepID=UPI0024ACB8D7|nr:VQ motif-containing protein 31-like [Mercurialis annua]XP_050223073.2 VQ motif-containing protein 31-like [Mercurialis annua]